MPEKTQRMHRTNRVFKSLHEPLAFIRIDPCQKKIPAVYWHSDHDRPIFFVELRERYMCSWCEMHDGRLILISSHDSRRRAQQVRYPVDATIIGRVTGVTMDLVEPSDNVARARAWMGYQRNSPDARMNEYRGCVGAAAAKILRLSALVTESLGLPGTGLS